MRILSSTLWRLDGISAVSLNLGLTGLHSTMGEHGPYNDEAVYDTVYETIIEHESETNETIYVIIYCLFNDSLADYPESCLN